MSASTPAAPTPALGKRPQRGPFAWAGAFTGFYPATATDPAMGEIYVVGVDPDFQRLGLGRALVLAGLAWLAQAGESNTVSPGCAAFAAARTASSRDRQVSSVQTPRSASAMAAASRPISTVWRTFPWNAAASSAKS